MKKLTRKNLSELAQTLPVIEKDVQASYIGGGDGTYENPYTAAEAKDLLDNHSWEGGYVMIMDYVVNLDASIGESPAYCENPTGSDSDYYATLSANSDYYATLYADYVGSVGLYTGSSDAFNDSDKGPDHIKTMSWQELVNSRFPVGAADQFLMDLLRKIPFLGWWFGSMVDKLNESLDGLKLLIAPDVDVRYNITYTSETYTSGRTVYNKMTLTYYSKSLKTWKTVENIIE